MTIQQVGLAIVLAPAVVATAALGIAVLIGAALSFRDLAVARRRHALDDMGVAAALVMLSGGVMAVGFLVFATGLLIDASGR